MALLLLDTRHPAHPSPLEIGFRLSDFPDLQRRAMRIVPPFTVL
jgi:hypothetical protein